MKFSLFLFSLGIISLKASNLPTQKQSTSVTHNRNYRKSISSKQTSSKSKQKKSHHKSGRKELKSNDKIKHAEQKAQKKSHHKHSTSIKDPAKYNPNCALWSGWKCLKCAIGSYWDNKTCVQSNPLCKNTAKDGCCTQCYVGYELKDNKCIVSPPQFIDPLCHSFLNGKCVECSTRAYFGKDGLCANSNPLCKTFDTHDGCCTSCYTGYNLNGGNCVIDINYKGKRQDSVIKVRKDNERRSKSEKKTDCDSDSDSSVDHHRKKWQKKQWSKH